LNDDGSSKGPSSDPYISSALADSVETTNHLTSDEARFILLNHLPTGIPPVTSYSNAYLSKPLFVNNIVCQPPDWKLLEKVPTEKVPMEKVPDWFDVQVSIFRFI
jgi:hypothetical protein